MNDDPSFLLATVLKEGINFVHMSANVDPSFSLATVQKEEVTLVPQMKARTTVCGQPKYLSDY